MAQTVPATIAESPAGQTNAIAWTASPDAIRRATDQLAFPIILENLFQTALGTANMLMVAQLGASAIAGIGSATQILWVLQSAFGAITTGTTVLVAHFIGAQCPRDADRVLKQSLLVGALLSLVCAGLGLFFSEWFIEVLGAEADVVELGADYLRITLVGIFFMIAMFVVGGALRGAGDSRTPMLVTGIINLLNIALSYVLIFGTLGFPALGVAGAGWAVTISRALGTAMLFAILWRGKSVIHVRGRHDWKPDRALIGRILRIGLPSMIEQLLMSGGMLLYGVIAIRLGTLIYAAQRVTFQLISLAFMPGMGYAMAATAMVGQCLGAKQPDLAERASAHAVKMATLIMAVMGLVLGVFGRPLMRLFSADPEMIRIGAAALIVIAISQPLQAVGQVLAGSLRGAGDTRFPMMATFLGVWMIRLPLGYLFGITLGWGLAGIYTANVIDAAARALANWLRYRKGTWRTLEV